MALDVPAGFVMLSYLADAGAPSVHIASAETGSVTFLTGASSAEAGIVLAAGAPALALHSALGGRLVVSLRGEIAGAEATARFSVEALVRDAPKPVAAQDDPEAPDQREATAVTVPMSILAHVSRRGDIIVEGGDWVCGPDLPMPIEGLELRLGHALPGLEILTSAIVNLRGHKVTAPHPLGSFAGTRGRSSPLLGVTFALGGPLADQYVLRGEALFLGAAIVVRAGQRISLSGQAGEALLGLRLSLERLPDSVATPALALPVQGREQQPGLFGAPALLPEAVSPASLPSLEGGSRVRVFRAGGLPTAAHPVAKATHSDQGLTP